MGIPEPPRISESERKKLYDPKPLKCYRPPLRSDPRTLIEKVSDLSLINKAECSSKNCGGTNSSSNRNHARSGQSWPQQTFRVIDGNDIPLTRNKTVKPSTETKADETSSGLNFPNEENKVKPCDALPLKCGKNPVLSARQSQSWRLGLYIGSDAQNSESSVKSQSMEHLRRMASTPLPPADLPTPCEVAPSSLNSRNIAVHNIINQPLAGFRPNEAKNYDSSSDISFDQSSLSTFDDDIVCLNPDSPVPQPILLLPVPENLRKYRPMNDMDQSDLTRSSSGVSSLNCSLQCSYSRSSSPSMKELSDSFLSQPASALPIQLPTSVSTSTSVESTSDVSSPSQKIAASSPSPCSSIPPVYKDQSEPVPIAYSNSLVENLRRNSTHDSASDIETPGSSPGKVLASWKTSFASTSIRKRTRSVLSSRWEDSECNTEAKSTMASMGLPTSFGTPDVTKRKAFDSPRTDPDWHQLVRTCFSKQFKFEPSNWGLPDPALLFSSKPWELSKFQGQKRSLNSVKDELNDLSLQDWHAHTRRRNKAGNVIWQLRKKINPEFPTQAWCKFYENASSFPLVPQKAVNQKSLNSIHLCEAPGAFITSLNHFLRVNYGNDFKFDWRAVTLNPYYEGNPLSCMINDDRFILNTLDKWLFGKDNTGDLMNRENLISIMEGASQLGEVLLVTGDGSFDCQDNPAEQEDIVSWLHYCETVSALQILAPGGSFLIKMFTFYEHLSICLMYLLNCVFKRVVVNKPVTSKEGNSEVYVVCLDYLGAHAIQPWLDVLMESYGPNAPQNTLFPLESIPSNFLDQLYRCSDFFRRLQIDVIQENLRSYHQPAKRDNSFTVSVRHRIADNFLSRFKLEKLDRNLYLVDKQQLKNVSTPNLDPKFEEGSFNDRRKRLALSPEEELKYIKDDLIHLDVVWPGDFDIFWIDFPENPKGFKVVKGKPITKVRSSKFCLGRLLKIRNRVREIAYSHFKVQVTEGMLESDTREFPWPDQADATTNKRKIITLDFKNELWTSLEDGSNATHEKNACRKILAAIENEVFRDDCLELRGYPLLTQFNVGLVFLLGHLFEKVGFVQPKGQDIRVLFYSYRKFHPKMKCHWDEVVSAMDENGEVVLSVVQISELSDGDFYKYVTEINNLCVVEQIKDLLKSMSAVE